MIYGWLVACLCLCNKCFGGHQANWGQQAEAMWRNVANEMFQLREGYSSCTAYLALFFVRISTCSWKSVIISLCFFFKSVAVSSDSRWTSSSSLRSFSSSASRLRLASNCQRELLQSLLYIDGIYISDVLTWCSAPPSASSRRSDICMTWTLRSAFSRSIWGEGEVDQIRHDSFSYFIIYISQFSTINTAVHCADASAHKIYKSN